MEQNRRGNVLVVEDDLLVRDIIVDILGEAGLDVLEAGSAGEALRLLAIQPVDAVVTDVDMPGQIDGIGLARRICELSPAVGVVVISGGPARALPAPARFLAKPFTASGLLKSVTRLLERRLYAAS